MGDRANVKVVSESSGEVYLYTHWYGTELPETVQQALEREVRWDDPIYLARIIFSHMIKDELETETGYGISSKVGDGDDRILEVNTDTQIITIYKRGIPKIKYSFDDYINMEVTW